MFIITIVIITWFFLDCNTFYHFCDIFRGKVMNGFAERLKLLRIENKLTQEQLSKEVGVAQSAIAFWESKARVPSLDMAIAFAKYFNVSLDYLAGLTDKK